MNTKTLENTTELTGNAALMARWENIKDPLEALGEILEYEYFFGYDPYYGDLRDSLLEMADRIYGERK